MWDGVPSSGGSDWCCLLYDVQEQRRRTLRSVYLCAMSDGSVLEAMPRELIWELAGWIEAVYSVK